MTDYHMAARTIAHFEGFLSHAKWDVNHWRLGYGSDTMWNGTHDVQVTRTSVTTQVNALINLSHRIPQFENVIIGEVGHAHWDNLPETAKSALISFVYNYGSLGEHLSKVVMIGNLRSIAAAVEARRFDNDGVNAHRRDAEARMIEHGIAVA
jgi:GH24 family phage-related lysozyme (muramidase)